VTPPSDAFPLGFRCVAFVLCVRFVPLVALEPTPPPSKASMAVRMCPGSLCQFWRPETTIGGIPAGRVSGPSYLAGTLVTRGEVSKMFGKCFGIVASFTVPGEGDSSQRVSV
jgi:hypothetical protein